MTGAARFAACLLLALTAAACGKKGPPIAPELRLPLAPTALQGTVDGDAVVVTWTNPGTRFDGSQIKDLTLTTLYRREETGAGPPKVAMSASGRVVGYEEIARIRLDSPAPATVDGAVVRWVDRRGLVPGHRYVYVATATDAEGRSSPPSERRFIMLLAAPEPPADVQATGGEGAVTLTWQPPAALSDGNPVSGDIRYIVLRGTGGGGLSPITPAPIPTTSFTDTGLQNDTPYRYAVRAIRTDGGATATGPESAVVAATPAITTPPRPPENLVAVPTGGAVGLAWNPSRGRPLALYSVYRAAEGGEFERIGTIAPERTTYTDRDVQRGATYRYAVTATDETRQANESARSNEVTVTMPR